MSTPQPAHVLINGKPACKLGCFYRELLDPANKITCDHLSTQAAHRAARVIRQRLPLLIVRVRRGPCPALQEVPDGPRKSLGRVAYEAHRDADNGRPKRWALMTARQRIIWEAAAEAVAEAVINRQA